MSLSILILLELVGFRRGWLVLERLTLRVTRLDPLDHYVQIRGIWLAEGKCRESASVKEVTSGVDEWCKREGCEHPPALLL